MQRASAVISIVSCLSLCMLYTTFAAQQFDIVLERVTFRDINAKYCSANGTVNRINKTTKALTVFFTTFQDLSNDATMTVQIYARYGNEYKKLPIRWERTVCDALNVEFLWIKNQLINTEYKFPFRCPVKKGTYFIKDLIPNAKEIPPTVNLMWNQIIFELTFDHGNSRIGTISVYITLDHEAELKRSG